ncbi:hypothetical protein SAY87_007839 [Trapa incisa]|uniref:Uncharacterized protein n=1 Tax=Trapa incisa TaxID=236973 RepID=A0AAN7KH76_9MYRT|nr:hypothetical protein SAY87_007839 [Trapa incisa]
MQDGFSTVDGFIEVSENLGEMIKYVANEPSVGLFYIQQHTQNAVPNVINLKNSVRLKSYETALHTEDSEDSIVMVRSMKDCGLPIADEMISDIKKSLSIISVKQPKKGMISSPISSFNMERSNSLGSNRWKWGSPIHYPEDGEGKVGYFSSVFKSAKHKDGNLKCSQLDLKDPVQLLKDEMLSISGSTLLGGESDELPLSSQVTDQLHEAEGGEIVAEPGEGISLLPVSKEYQSFRAKREAKLEEWLKGNGKHYTCNGATA